MLRLQLLTVALPLALCACGSTFEGPSRPRAPRLEPPASTTSESRSGTGSEAEPQARPEQDGPAPAGEEARALEGGEPGSDAGAESASSSVLLARVGMRDVRAQDLLERWLHRESMSVRSYIEELILEELVEAESARLGLVLDEAELDEALETAVGIAEDEIRRGGTDMALDEFVRRRFALEPVRYRELLREEQRLDLLAERCVRAWLLTTDHVLIETLVVGDRALVEDILEQLGSGGDFDELARRYSLEPGTEDGLDLHRVVRSPAPLSRLAFNTAVGEIGGPIPEGGRYLLVRVRERVKGQTGGWGQVGEAVEASLRERPIEDPEYWQWKDAMLQRYPVDMQPFLRALPEAAGD